MRINSDDAALLARELLVLNEPSAIADPRASDSLSEPMSFQSRYRISRLIGSGGMGDVYEAEQLSPQRRVAIKVVRAELVTSEFLRRFDHEVRVLGSLKHPGISQIYDAGHCSRSILPGQSEKDDRTTPFFAMEFVEGEPLTRYAATRKLGINDRLELMAKVCDAVAHAHQRGIIHRDLKPANILVTQGPIPVSDPARTPVAHATEIKILDFGIARAVNSDLSATSPNTQAGALIGTACYMSPEQMFGATEELDTRSDVYSLGVVMYELLSDQLPYALTGVGADRLANIMFAVKHETPILLSSISRSLRGDLETIVGKALEKDRDRRYQAVSELATDIRRFLNNETITARKPSAFYELSKLIRRNQALAAAIVALAGVVVICAVATSWLWRLEVTARNDAEVARRGEAALRIESQGRERHATAVSLFLREILEAAHPARSGFDVRLIDLLDEASAKLDERFTTQPGQGAAVATALGESYLGIGALPKSEALLTKAAAFWAASPSRDAIEALQTRVSLAHGIVLQDRAGEARSMLIDVHAQAVLRAGPDSEIAQRALGDLALAHLDAGDLPAAETAARSHLRSLLQTPDAEPRTRIKAELNLASIFIAQERLREAEEILCRGVEDARARFGDDDYTSLVLMNNYGNVLRRTARLPEADAMLNASLAGRVRTLGELHPETLNTMHNLAYLLRDLKQLDRAFALFSRCYELRGGTLGEKAVPTLLSLHGVGIVAFDMKHFDASQHALQESADGIVAALGVHHQSSVNLVSSLADFYRLTSKFDRAAIEYTRAAAAAEAVHGEQSCQVGRFRLLLGECLLRLARYDEAAEAFTSAEAIFNDCNPPNRRIVRRLHDNLCALHACTNDLASAARHNEIAREIDATMRP